MWTWYNSKATTHLKEHGIYPLNASIKVAFLRKADSLNLLRKACSGQQQSSALPNQRRALTQHKHTNPLMACVCSRSRALELWKSVIERLQNWFSIIVLFRSQRFGMMPWAGQQLSSAWPSFTNEDYIWMLPEINGCFLIESLSHCQQWLVWFFERGTVSMEVDVFSEGLSNLQEESKHHTALNALNSVPRWLLYCASKMISLDNNSLIFCSHTSLHAKTLLS